MKRFKSFLFIVLVAICFVGCNPIVGGTTPEPTTEPTTEPSYVNPDLSDQYAESEAIELTAAINKVNEWFRVSDNGFDWKYLRIKYSAETFYIIAFFDIEDFYKKIGNRNMASLSQSSISVPVIVTPENTKAIIVVRSLENEEYSSGNKYNRSYFGILENSNDTNFTKYIKADDQTYTLEWLEWFQDRTITNNASVLNNN